MTFIDYLLAQGLNYKENVDSSKITSIKAGGQIKTVIYPNNKKEFTAAVMACSRFHIKFKILGGCTNSCFSDNGYDGAVIFTSNLKSIKIEGENIVAEAGATISEILRFAAHNDKEIASELFGIPGTIGGAVRNNAGAYGKEIADFFISGEFFDTSNFKTLILDRENLLFSYRYSYLQSSTLALIECRLKTRPSEKEKCFNDFKRITQIRRAQQPNEPSLGSFYKRRDGVIPAKLIDDLGLKGYTVGGASVSKKHAGFIVNSDKCTVNEIEKLAEYIEYAAVNKYGIHLIREAEIIK
ncbi:MAG: UDP-N-acetylmuramate dehydrogenase [Clostridia bacterium]|nr:UDP-N-acetylmuramate dehydrogenase [Clostridia bacterium]